MLPPMDEQKTLRDQMMTKNYDAALEKTAAPDFHKLLDHDVEVCPTPYNPTAIL